MEAKILTTGWVQSEAPARCVIHYLRDSRNATEEKEGCLRVATLPSSQTHWQTERGLSALKGPKERKQCSQREASGCP